MIFETQKSAGDLLFELTAERDNQEVLYASVTAPSIVRCEVYLNDEIYDIVYAGAGGSHSWWAGAAAPLCRPLTKGDKIRVKVSGPAAFRIDFS